MTTLLPTYAVDHIVGGLSEYVTTSLSLSDETAARQLRSFLKNPRSGMFRGPYVRTRLPYASANDWEGALSWLPEWFTPYKHQAEAFRRLSSQGKDPEPTLVVTGTGSGKTESFLYPILDHCVRSRKQGQPDGIKAIILYPMNALAADQEQRLAKLISSEPRLAGVTAGLYTGEERSGERKTVSEHGLITERGVMRAVPPDILLTNYKMLDLLLLRAADENLWKQSADSLQYIVLDEFHTYDAAQGTDVAMLLRRLGLKLRSYRCDDSADDGASSDPRNPLGRITPVATSATLGGGGAEGARAMREFARTVFGKDLGEDCIVGETLLDYASWQQTIPELTGRPRAEVTTMPAVGDVERIVDTLRAEIESGRDYAESVHEVFCREVLRCESDITAAIAAMAESELFGALIENAGRALPLAHSAPMPGAKEDVPSLVEVLFPNVADRRKLGERAAEFVAFALSEMAYLRARFGADRGWEGKKIPGVEAHLWVREVSRVDRAVHPEGEDFFRWSDDGTAEGAWLPAIYCRHCGRSGWMTVMSAGGDTIETSPQEIRRRSMSDPDRRRPLIDATAEYAAGELRSGDGRSRVAWLDVPGTTIHLREPEKDEDAASRDELRPVLLYSGDEMTEAAKEERCPACGEADSIRYLGSSVATLLSVAVSNLFGMEDLDSGEKKTLVFTDSVQDAAHRAGFMQSRSRAFTLRSRLYRAVGKDGSTLDELAPRMVDQASQDEDPLRSLFELVPPDMTQSPEFAPVWEKGARKKGQATKAQARDTLTKRLALDAALEFGDRADLPRSLVSTGTLSVGMKVADEVLLQAARAAASAQLREDAEADVALLRWARGVLERMRLEGGIDHEWFETYLKEDARPYLLNRPEARAKGIPAFPRYGAPHYPRTGRKLEGAKGKKKNHSTVPVGAATGWYAYWTHRCLQLDSKTKAGHAAVSLFQQLAGLDVIASKLTRTGGTIYRIPPEHLMVQREDDPEALECDVCRMRLAVDARGRDALSGASCFVMGCRGTYQRVALSEDYYGRLYRSTNSRSVTAAEHTGLLEDKKRALVESSFKAVKDRPADAPNVLVATPTLEMGIDIGDLSTVMLSSLPRTVASYIQRVGRAGRLSGNSLALALVRGRGKALGSLDYPLETISGQVTAPAAYLSARDILRRQFIAYLLDHHHEITGDNEGENNLASRLFTDPCLLLELKATEEELDAFCATVEEFVSPDVLSDLRTWALDSEGMTRDISDARRQWMDEYGDYAARQGKLLALDADLKATEEKAVLVDDDHSEQQSQVAASLRFVTKKLTDLAGEYWPDALERLGILPNFTLLDHVVDFTVGVSEHNVANGQLETQTNRYQRGISSALTELAPGNTFYVQGTAARIDSIDLGMDNASIRQWRVCPACSYAAVDDPASKASVTQCPVCGSAGFADLGQVIDTVEMSRVSATVDRSRSAISDFDDDRRFTRFITQLTFSAEESKTRPAWYLDECGVGMEYLPQVTMRWLNLGRMGRGTTLQIAGRDMDAPQFRVCAYCGHLDSQAGANSWRDHQPWCPHRHSYKEESITVALGRTLTTQGVLVHLPQRFTVAEKQTLPSLLAALKLGFHEYLGGNPDHLDIEMVSHVVNDKPANLLLIHDRIPGGTGYLAQFTDPEEVHEMLKAAYRTLRDCACADTERALCPECLLPYVPPSAVGHVTREAAVAALAKILANDLYVGDDVDPLEVSWEGHVTNRPPVGPERSELEARFLILFREMLEKRGATITDGLVGRYAHWKIRFGDSRSTPWELREQEDKGFTIPDFVLAHPDSKVRDIHLYLDGWRYHKNQVAGDFAKRNKLAGDGCLPWSLTWKNLDDYENGIAVNRKPSRKHRGIAQWRGLSAEMVAASRGNPLALLLDILPEKEEVRESTGYAGLVPDEALKRGRILESDFAVSLTVPVEGAPEQDDWEEFLRRSNLAYLRGLMPSITVERAAVDTAVPAEPVSLTGVPETTTPAAEDTAAATPATDSARELSGPWHELAAEFADESDVEAALQALARAGAPAPSLDHIGEEIDGVPTVVVWQELKVALCFDEEDVIEGYRTFAATFTELPADFSKALNM